MSSNNQDESSQRVLSKKNILGKKIPTEDTNEGDNVTSNNENEVRVSGRKRRRNAVDSNSGPSKVRKVAQIDNIIDSIEREQRESKQAEIAELKRVMEEEYRRKKEEIDNKYKEDASKMKKEKLEKGISKFLNDNEIFSELPAVVCDLCSTSNIQLDVKLNDCGNTKGGKQDAIIGGVPVYDTREITGCQCKFNVCACCFVRCLKFTMHGLVFHCLACQKFAVLRPEDSKLLLIDRREADENTLHHDEVVNNTNLPKFPLTLKSTDVSAHIDLDLDYPDLGSVINVVRFDNAQYYSQDDSSDYEDDY